MWQLVTPIVLLIIFIIKAMLNNKKTLLTGPMASGKTTFLKYIAKEEENIPDGPSGTIKHYKVKNGKLNEVTDFSGAEEWLTNFDQIIKEHDYILFFFDVSLYIKDIKYREHSNARISFIHQNSTSSQVIVIVGTHIDKLSGNYKAKVESYFAGKPYRSLLKRMAYINTTKKECVKKIYDELKKN